MKEDTIWHIDNNLLKLSPQAALSRILGDDKANYDKAESELSKEIGLLDDGISLYVELVQAAYKRIDEWRTVPSLQAAIAMAVVALNYILVARHSILLGYYPETRGLLRSCHEAVTRCYLFFTDDREAQKFLSGEEIWQHEVDAKLAEIFSSENADKVRKELRGYYKDKSKDAHPNMESLRARMLEPTIGIPHVIGGFLSTTHGRIVIAVLIRSVITALHILSAVVAEQTGKWQKDYEGLKEHFNQLLYDLQESTAKYE